MFHPHNDHAIHQICSTLHIDVFIVKTRVPPAKMKDNHLDGDPPRRVDLVIRSMAPTIQNVFEKCDAGGR